MLRLLNLQERLNSGLGRISGGMGITVGTSVRGARGDSALRAEMWSKVVAEALPVSLQVWQPSSSISMSTSNTIAEDVSGSVTYPLERHRTVAVEC